MKISLAKIDKYYNGAKSFFDVPMPAMMAFRMAKNKKIIEDQLEEFGKIRLETIKKYSGEPDGDRYQVKEENTVIFTKEITDLMNEEVELDISTIVIKAIEDAGIEVSATMLSSLLGIGILEE